MADYIPIAETSIIAQIGDESAYGTEVDATYRMMSVKFDEQAKMESEAFRASGAKVPTLVLRGIQNATLPFSGKATYEELPKFLKSISRDAATDIPSSTVEIGNSVSANTYAGCVVNSFTLTATASSVDISGEMFAASRNTNTLKSGVTGVTPTPIDVDHVSIKLNNTAVTDWFELNLNMSDLWVGCQYGGTKVYGGANEGEVNIEFTIKLEATASNRALALNDSSVVTPVEITLTNGTKTIVIKFNAINLEPESYQAVGAVYAIGAKYTAIDTVVGTTANIFDVTVTP